MTNEELQKEMIAAMKAKDKVRLSIIRQVKAEVKNIEVNERRDVTEEDVNSMIKGTRYQSVVRQCDAA